jgi:hypothetical protein
MEKDEIYVESDDESEFGTLEEHINSFVKELKEREDKCLPEDSERLGGQQIQIENYSVLMTKQRIKSWLQPKPIEGSIFLAIGTNVDSKGNIYMHKIEDEAILKAINAVINEHYQQQQPKRWNSKVGDPCIANYENDGCKYL